MEFGREIAVNGVRPDWLADGVSLRLKECGQDFYDDVFEARAVDWHTELQAIRLPADHFAYKALDAVFQPWGGGDAAPADQDDSGKVLLRDGRIIVWNSPSLGWQHTGSGGDVFGYRKRAEQSADTVTIARMTEAECMASWNRYDGSLPDWLRSIGLIRPETRAERFTRETGFEVTDAVEAALEWERK